MTLQITPEQATQTAAYNKKIEQQIRKLLTNGLNLQLQAIELRKQLEAQLAPGGQLDEMADYYANQYARLCEDTQEAFAALEARVLQNQAQMCAMHNALLEAEPDSNLFPGIICPQKEPRG